jgi:hypothetical protein
MGANGGPFGLCNELMGSVKVETFFDQVVGYQLPKNGPALLS